FFRLQAPLADPKYRFTEGGNADGTDGSGAEALIWFGRQFGNERPDGASLEWRIFRDFVSSAF
uniref:hypothetical protein n=1 Tax=uncultured Paracoccus sp. TaxID=189685 RepID=UPI002628BE34